MAKGKTKSVFFCKECGYESAKWMGQCPACHAWNSITEEIIHSKNSASGKKVLSESAAPTLLSEISLTEQDRIDCGIGELDRVLGGGIVPGSLILVGGDPGIGKSTLLLQMCRSLAGKRHQILYISGEESLKQIKMRADRLGSFEQDMLLLCETNLTDIERVIRDKKPEVVIIDSIQTMYDEEVSSAPGSVSQVREATAVLLQISKTLGIAIFIVGHVTKEGTVAGPRVLEHMVDTVLYFEGDRHASYRILRGVKNRFGSTNEIGVFEMREEGLIEVENPSEYMLDGRPENASGTVTACTIEGTRPILIEIQALVCQTNFGIPRRQVSGADLNRLNLLMAVLEKRLGLSLGNCDAYVNMAGGMRIVEPAVDLGIAMAIVSSFMNQPLDDKLIAVGEVGLSGEVRAVSMIEQRVAEAVKMGFTICVVPKVSLERLKGLKTPKGGNVEIVAVESVRDAIQYIKKKKA
ncbi:MAG: DNA repair protein RadA [Lachnospiraceae bacterium]|nr:DNA repair protein RadA [Lachnospiraceae bacterium]